MVSGEKVMAITQTDIHVKRLVEYTFSYIKNNPEKNLKEIFGDYTLEPHAALYGAATLEKIKNWLVNSKIPVVLGFDVVEAQFPAVTVHLAGSVPSIPVIGDVSIGTQEILLSQERDILVAGFQPKAVTWAPDRSYLQLTLPDSMPFADQELFFSGLRVRDSHGREYVVGRDDQGNITLSTLDSGSPIDQIDLSRLELVSCVVEGSYSQGAMVFDETITIAVHGHSNRPEGQWLSSIVLWGLLKFRPLLTATYGMDLGFPSASDYSKDDSYLGSMIWRRFITLQAKSVWSWEIARNKDILGLLLSVEVDRAGS
jgi:hypothetical protein